MKKKDKFFILFTTAIVSIIIVAICISIYQSNYRNGIREWIADYNEQAKEYNEGVEEKNKTVNKFENLQLIILIPEEIADDKEIRKISDKLDEYKKINEEIMDANDRIVN